MPTGLVAFALAVVLAVGCASSSKTAAIATVPGPGGVGAMPADVCSVASSTQVKDLLGATATGTPTTFAPYYKTCDWTAGSNTLSVKLIQIGHGQVGFGPTKVGLNSSVLTGVGDKATYSTGTNSGLNESLLVTNKGIVSLVVDVSTQAAADPQKVKDRLTAVAKQVFTALGA